MPQLYQNRPTANKSVSGTIGEKDLVSERLIRLTCTYPYFLQEFTLLDDAEWDDRDQGNDHELFTAPILTRDAYVAVGGEERIGQYGVMGKILVVGSVPHCECLHAETFIQVKKWRPVSRGPQNIPKHGECQLIR